MCVGIRRCVSRVLPCSRGDDHKSACSGVGFADIVSPKREFIENNLQLYNNLQANRLKCDTAH